MTDPTPVELMPADVWAELDQQYAGFKRSPGYMMHDGHPFEAGPYAPQLYRRLLDLEADLRHTRAQLNDLRSSRILSVVFGHHKGAPRPFALYRKNDATGISGTGIVAEGAVFSDGTAVLRWLTEWPTSVVFHDRGIEAIEKIHGHGGATEIVWLSDELDSLAAMEQQRDAARAQLADVHRHVADLDTQLAAAQPVLDAARAVAVGRVDREHGRMTMEPSTPRGPYQSKDITALVAAVDALDAQPDTETSHGN
jgi:hypothetical protein